jgi:phosphatidylserine decarboxylase
LWEVLDPRDLKYVRNVVDYRWDERDDPFRWRERLPFARWGLCELLVIGFSLAAATVAAAFLPAPWNWAAIVPGVLLALVVFFFRDPQRQVPMEANTFVSPADGKLVEITELEDDEYIGGPAVRLGIFLSIFNVHINRAPARSRVIELRYSPGKFRNALSPRSALENENMWIALEEEDPPHRRYIVRQISGAIARRIVCDLKPGEVIERGHKFGMIKLGSRTELILPLADGLQITANLGETVKAGSTILARYPKGQ